MKDLTKVTNPIAISRIVSDVTVADDSFCTYLQEKAEENNVSFACKDNGTSYLSKDKAFGYALKDFNYYDNGLTTAKKGCKVIADYCKSSSVLYEANCKKIIEDGVEKKYVFLEYWPTYISKDCKDYGDSYICYKGTCIPGLCGNGVVDDGEQCDDGGVKSGDGCSQTCKIEKAPDLVVQKIHLVPHQEKCINSLTFDICNVGNMPVLDDFNILIKINDVERKLTYLQGKYGGYGSGCVTLEDPKKLDLAQFGVGLKEVYDVSIVLDTENVIAEKDEENVFESSNIYSGDTYLNNGSVCEVTCTDLDAYLGGKAYLESSKIIGLNSGGYEYELEDFCSVGGVILYEQTCDKTQSGYESKSLEIPCYMLNMACENGACVEKDYIGFDCKDLGDVVKYWDVDGIEHEVKSVCVNDDEEEVLYSKKLKDYSCQSDTPILTSWTKDCACYDGKCINEDEDCDTEVNCSDLDGENTNKFSSGEITLDLICDLSVLGETNVGSESKKFEDHCGLVQNGGQCDSDIDNQDNPLCLPMGTLYEFSCNAGYNCKEGSYDSVDCQEGSVYLEKDCSKDGKTCVNGACSTLVPQQETCVVDEYSELSGEYYDSTAIKYTNVLGTKNYYQDKCLSNTILLEYSCDNNTAKYEKYDCSKEGLVCSFGACIDPANPEEEYVPAPGEIKDGEYCYKGECYSLDEDWCLEDPKGLTHCEGEGEIEYFENGCVNDVGGKVFSSNYLHEWICGGPYVDNKLTDCTEQGDICEDAQCK